MSFELAAVIVVSVAAVVLGLICYHLLGRLELLERAVQGGLAPPSTRLSREQFERRFKLAHARSELAAELETGLLIVVGPEHPGSELARTLDHLPRRDGVEVREVTTLDAELLGIATTPFLFIVDESKIRAARPVASSHDVSAALEQLS